MGGEMDAGADVDVVIVEPFIEVFSGEGGGREVADEGGVDGCVCECRGQVEGLEKR